MSLAAFAVAALGGFEAAEAKPMSCSIKQSYCNERCVLNNSGEQIGACIKRNCDRQFNNCMSDSSGGGDRGGAGGGRGGGGGGGGGSGKSSGKPIVRDHRGRG
ncbi:hypothetical protein [Bradyrhizobium sp. DOA1]|uniref:hypothetical protein n=1 Tax=Bradyrhizobium sp. DOA1 TaxID=1126616 RepID=UPI00077CCFFA|nr:hypothetical protein [Bradyrhizobium sp. DOA1]